MSRLFAQEGFLWRALNTLTDIFALSTLFLICCIPVVTVGASLTALYDSVTRCVRFKEPAPYQRFWNTFRKELKTCILTTVLWGVLIAAFVLARHFLFDLGAESRAAVVIAAVYYVALLIPIGSLCWACTILSRFTFDFRDLNMTAFRFTFARLPVTVLLVIMTIEALELMLNYFFPAFFLPAILMLLWSLFVERVFKKLGAGLKKYSDTPGPEITEEPAECPPNEAAEQRTELPEKTE